MSFRTGSLSFARFRVVGDAPTSVSQQLLDNLNANVLRPTSVGPPSELEVGWVAGRHVLDTTFQPETVAFGNQLLFGMRLDTNVVPAEIKRAYKAIAEQAAIASNQDGKIDREAKLTAREDAEAQWSKELADGRYRRSKLIEVVWDLQNNLLLAPIFTENAVRGLCELFSRSFECRLQPLSAGAMAWETLSDQGKGRDYDDFSPSPFTEPPVETDDDRHDARNPVVPWSQAGPEPKDFLGNEFLIWLWWMVETDDALIATPQGQVAVTIDRILEMDCAWDVTGRQILQADGPTRRPEAHASLSCGKWPRRIGLLIAADQDHWQLTLQGDQFRCTNVKLPKPDDATTLRDVLEHRLSSLRSLDSVLTALFQVFLKHRVDRGWPSRVTRIRSWIRQRGVRGEKKSIQSTPEIITEIKSETTQVSSL